MNEILVAIALLCQVHPSGNYGYSTKLEEIAKYSKDCHKYYAGCIAAGVSKNKELVSLTLIKCMAERP